MIVLAIDTSTDAVSVALSNSKQLLASAHVISDRRHGELLTPMIHNVCQQADIAIREVDVVGVDVGPGLFTGMRVGIVTAKMVAQVLDIPIIGVSSLEIIARAVQPTEQVVLATVDARRGELYWAMYRNELGKNIQVKSPRVGTVNDCVIDLIDRGQTTLMVGTPTLRYRSMFSELIESLKVEWASEQIARPNATNLSLITAEMALLEQFQTPSELAALYLREPDAEINWQTRVIQ